ncbi:MAG: exonuclease domain-containing protein [Bacteroidota bacterium]
MERETINNNLKQLNFTAIDFETANEKRHSPCSLGIVVFKNGKVDYEEHILIRPKEFRFTTINSQIHGITESDVVNAPEFNEVWQRIEHLIQHSIVLAHNASFDIDVLKKTLNIYGIATPTLKSACTIKLAGKAFPNLPGQKLNQVADFLQIPLLNHHNSLADARVASEIGLRSIPRIDTNIFSYHLEDITSFQSSTLNQSNTSTAFFEKQFSKKNIDSALLQPNLTNANPDNPFYNKKVVFTGDLQSINRKDAALRIQAMGADIDTAISRKTQIVVIGQKAGPTKLKKIEELRATGYDIKIIEEAAFLSLIQ